MHIPSLYLRYGSAVIGVAVAWFIHGLLDEALGDELSFAVFYLAALLAAALGGLGPGLIALALSSLIAIYFFVPPRPYFGIQGLDNQLSLALYVTVGVVIVFMGNGLRAAQQRVKTLALEAREGQRQLEQTVAEQQHAQEALRTSERLLWLALDAARMSAWNWDLRTGKVALSDTAQDVMGLKCTHIDSSEEAFACVHPEDRARHRAEMERAIADKSGYATEFRVIRPSDNKVIWLEDRARVECDNAGTPVRLSGIIIDITARKRAEMHNALLAELGEHVKPDHGVEETLYEVAALVGRRLNVARALFGDIDEERSQIVIHRDYVAGLPSIAGVHPLVESEAVRKDARDGKVMRVRDVRTDPRTAPYASEFARLGTTAFLAVPLVRDGVWVATLALHDPEPRDWTPGEVELVRIVAERTWLAVENQRLATETSRSVEQFRNMANTVPDILYIGHSDGTIEYLSQRFTDYTGLPVEQALGRGWEHVIHPEDLPHFNEVLAECLDNRRPFESEMRVRGSDGLYRWFVSRAWPVPGSDGHIAQWFGTVSDIDDRRRAADDMREAARRKDEFLATLAHELRNPLAPIRNAVHILKAMGPAGERVAWARDVIERQVQQMSRLLDDLLDVSRITRGKIALHKEHIDMREVVDSALETSRPKVDAAGHTLEVVMPPEPLWVDGDATRLGQVLSNLLNNAATYTEPGGHIRLGVACEGERVVARVRDSGIGIPAEMLPHIFDMFTQVDVPQARAQRSLGIGLTLVQRLVQMHGGTVEAVSEGPGKGSEFVVRLPVAAPAEDHLRGKALQPEGEEALGRGRRILVVDDNEDSAESLSMYLEMLGNEVRIAYSGRQALDEARAFAPDVVLLDIGLPDTNGYEVARVMRRETGLEHALLVAQTGWGQDEDRQRSRAAGFDHHLVKPVDLEQLRGLLAGSSASAHAAGDPAVSWSKPRSSA